jgi:Flp pilus assembly protein TadG
MTSFIATCIARSARFARRTARNADGVAAVEFGFIAPVMLLMLVGTIEISRAITVDRRFGLVTSMVADLVTREKTMTAANLDKIYDIVGIAMGGYDNGTLKISVIPVKAHPTNATDTKVYAETTNRPSYPTAGGGVENPAKCAAYPLTADLVSAGSSVIVVKTSYTFSPILLGYILGTREWTDTATLSPRNSCVDFDGDNCVSTCFS